MPYKSDAQRRYMHAKHPDIAARWDAEIRGKRKKVSKASQFTFIGHSSKAAKLMKNPKKFKGAEVSTKNARRGYIDLTESWGGKSNKLYRAPNATRTTTTNLEGQKTNTMVTYQSGQLTKTGKGVVGGAGAGVAGTGYYLNQRLDKKPVKKNMSVSYWGVEHGEEIAKATKHENFVREGMAYKDKAARSRTMRQAYRNNAYISPRGKYRKENWKTLGKHTAIGAGVGAASGAALSRSVRGAGLGGLIGGELGAFSGSITTQNRAVDRAIRTGKKRGDIVPKNYRRLKLSPVND